MKWIAPHGATTATERYRNAEPLVAGSNPDAAFFNDVLDELLAVITTAEMEPTDANMHQIADAIVYLTNRAATSGVVKGSFWFGKTTANFTVPAPTKIGQTYIDFTNLKMYISNDGTSWTENGTFVKPEDIDFTILITSKFWDIVEQTDQQGGDAIYSYSTETWTYWPKIVNLDNVANLDLSNLTSTGKNIGLWCNNAAGIITEIPQDIKLEFNNNTITLKSGSKVYVPNGVGVFDTVTTTQDLSIPITSDGQKFIYKHPGNYINYQSITTSVSGATDSMSGTPWHLWYDTTNNVINRYAADGTTAVPGQSFPIAIVTVSGGQITSIDQVFNGFGYIGSTVFALPGVKGLIPDGRNADGSLKNRITNDFTTVKTVQVNTSTAKIAMYSGGGLGSQTNNFGLNEAKNYNYDSGILTNALEVASVMVDSNAKIIAFTPKTVFHAVDYNDVSKVGFTGSYNDLTSRPTDLFDNKWSDHLLSNSSWLRADNFSWNSGTKYLVAYQHLVADIAGKTLQSETVGGVTVQFYLADDGHKICPATEETNVSNIYTATGVAWYYIIDTTNQRFKLPRTQFGLTGYRDAVGGYVAESLPNITGSFTCSAAPYSSITASGAFAQTHSGSATDSGSGGQNGNITLDASRSSSAYQDSAPVQQRATQMYLYFYVGTFSNSALENTAGLNASLFSGKADTNLLNTDANVDFVVESQEPAAENDYTWYRKYKSGWVEQGGNFATVYNDYHDESVVLPIAMSNSNYTCLISISSGGNARNSAQVDSKTTTGFTVHALTNITAYAAGWQVSGKAA